MADMTQSNTTASQKTEKTGSITPAQPEQTEQVQGGVKAGGAQLELRARVLELARELADRGVRAARRGSEVQMHARSHEAGNGGRERQKFGH